MMQTLLTFIRRLEECEAMPVINLDGRCRQ